MQPCQRPLAVQDLILIDCKNACTYFFAHRALSCLRKLHIEESKESDRPLTRADMADCPHLHQISGSDSLFAAEMGNLLDTWQESVFTKETIECHTPTRCNELRVWTKSEF